LETLTALEELWLGKNKIDTFKNLSTFTNLKILSIQSNRLTSLTGLSHLPQLEELYVSHNALIETNGLGSNHNLRVLDISNNKILHLSNLSHLTKLEELWASNCQLSSIQELEKELADKKNLETVYFEGNPLQLNSPVMYRNKIRLALPQVKQIDASKSYMLVVVFVVANDSSICKCVIEHYLSILYPSTLRRFGMSNIL
jgi:protein phosphatase 1 regulatory subunit 7